MSIYDRLSAMEIELSRASRPPAAYVPYTIADRLILVSGHLAYRDGAPWVGRLGEGMSTEDGRTAARSVGLSLLGTLEEAARSVDTDLNGIQRILKIVALVNATADFTQSHLVANGCSDLFNEVFGPRGAHARSAFGVAQLPMGACVEFELMAELADQVAR